ncbi:phage tail protein [Pandoraea captiosa]|uniref:Phage tail protein n=1 Tax=Pandoraea captiosa TaxID=2508302 RepID=A0A5E4ZFE5_9BURK|nr:putative phage tail protein [Pandoraea captiosa]VVE59746.1 phage tail protein [Pandoraea captiosa]
MSDHADLLARLLPPVAYDPAAPSVNADLVAEGKALDRFLADADMMLAGVVPSFSAIQLLPDWERLFAITPAADATLQQRMAKVEAKMNETGGLSIPYFINLAKSLGYTIEIQEPQPFRVDESRIGDELYVEDVIYQWLVVVEGAPNLAYYFRVGESAIGERLLDFSDPMLEEVIQDLKPAHTFVYFAYQG